MAPESFKAKLSSGLGVLDLLARLTPTDLDDEAVGFLRYLFQDTQVVDRAYDLWLKFKGKVDAPAPPPAPPPAPVGDL